MFGRNVRAVALVGVVLATTSVAGAAWAEGNEGQKSGKTLPAAELRSELQRQEEKLDRAIGGLTSVGDKLEESQGQVDNARAHQKELGRRAAKLDAAVKVQKNASDRARARLEDQVRVAYRGGDLKGLLLVLGGFLGGGDASATLQTTRLLTGSSRSIQDYKDTAQNLRFTLRQVEQSKAEYRLFGEEGQALVEELEGRESELRASVEGLGLKGDRLEKRLAELEAEEEAGLLKRPSATGGGDEGKERDRDAMQDQDEDHDAPADGVEQPDREEAEESRARELEIAREEIVTRPVEPIPYEEYVRLYRESAERYGFAGDWYVLAAVGKIESNHGENMGPSSAGAMGPMQFLPSTWSAYGVDGNGDGDANIMDPKDAIPAAAAYLKAGGAPDDWYAALFTYNHAGWYVEEVLAIAESYRRIHGDDTVGPYLEPATPPTIQAPPRSEPAPQPAPQPADVTGGEEDLRQERPVEEATTASDEKPQRPNDDPETDEQDVSEPKRQDTEDEATTQQHQYESVLRAGRASS